MPMTSMNTSAVTPEKLGMHRAIDLTAALTETFHYRKKDKRVIRHSVVDPSRWRELAGPLLYAVTDRLGVIRYVGKWESDTPLHSRWLRHDTIHHQERARNLYIRELDAGNGPLNVWSITVRELRGTLPREVAALSDKALAVALEAFWIRQGRAQLHWNKRDEPVPVGFHDGGLWS